MTFFCTVVNQVHLERFNIPLGLRPSLDQMQKHPTFFARATRGHWDENTERVLAVSDDGIMVIKNGAGQWVPCPWYNLDDATARFRDVSDQVDFEAIWNMLD